MPERLLSLFEAGASFSARYADWLRLVAAAAAAYNALKLSGFIRYLGRLLLKVCAPCWPIFRWLRNV